MQIQLIILYSAMKPAKIVRHGKQHTFRKYILFSSTEKAGKSAVTLNIETVKVFL